jgi:hypothetical protein
MSRKHAVAVAVLLAAAAAVGLFGLARTLGIGASASAGRAPDPVIAKRSHALDRLEISLRRELAKRPPRLPAVPKVTPIKAPSAPVAAAPAAPVAASAPRVVYVRPAPIVVHKPHHGDDHEAEAGDRSSDGGDGGD